MASKPLTYRDAGVDIGAQDKALDGAKDAIRRSFTPGVLADVGSFGGLFDPAKVGLGNAILVSSADGVGTKLEVAKRACTFDGVGRDLVQHCINDILCQGARPMFFMDYVAMGKLEPEVVAGLIRGCAEACADNGLALLGGETAEMPGLYAGGDFDLCGFIVGGVPRDQILDGTRVAAGQKLIGMGSDGLHTNGYSLARKVAFEVLGLELDDTPEELGGRTLGEALLAPHRCYLNSLLPLIESHKIAAFAHITGGGIPGNLNRVLGGQDAKVNLDAWEVPGLFRLLIEGGQIPHEEAFQAFNMGVGGILVVDAADEASVIEHLLGAGEVAFSLGELVEGTGQVHLVKS